MPSAQTAAKKPEPEVKNTTGTAPPTPETTYAVTATGQGGAVQSALASESDLGDYAGAGQENVRREDISTPFLLLLQALSPEVDPTSPKHVPGAAPGMFCSTLTKRLYPGDVGLEVIDCYFEPLLTRWVPRDKGGGFKGTVDESTEEGRRLLASGRPSEKNELTKVLPDGTEVININQHYLLVRPWREGLNELPWEPLVLGLSSTQIKKSRSLNAELGLVRVTNRAGALVPAPRFATVMRLTAVGESNAKGRYFGVKFELKRRVNLAELELAASLYKALQRGERRTAPTEETHGGYDVDAGKPGGQHDVRQGADMPY